jgi:hypothetical protein
MLEGLLRRKNEFYVNVDGSVRTRFTIHDSQGRRKTFDPSGSQAFRWLNRLEDLLRCFEQKEIARRGRPCPYLQQVKTEITNLYPSITDVYHELGEWRNELVHGNQYWMNRVPILANLICLLLIDEIDPAFYDGQRNTMERRIEWATQTFSLVRAPWDFYPPDL